MVDEVLYFLLGIIAGSMLSVVFYYLYLSSIKEHYKREEMVINNLIKVMEEQKENARTKKKGK